MSVNGLHRDRVKGRVRVSVRIRDRVRACRPDSSGNLLTRHKMEFARLWDVNATRSGSLSGKRRVHVYFRVLHWPTG